MTLKLYTLSGSPFGWKVQLALDHKHIPYEVALLSPDRGELSTPWFRALNPNGKLPVLVDGDFILTESDAILGYLDDAYPAFGPALFARDVRMRATQRSLAMQVTNHLYPPTRALVMALTKPVVAADPRTIATARDRIGAQLSLFASRLAGSFFNGDAPGAVDFTLLPLAALLNRLAGRHPAQDLTALVPVEVAGWRGRMEALPAYAHTFPPHWRTA